MSIGLSDKIAPLGGFPITEDVDTFGGLRIVADATERNSIVDPRRKPGMIVVQKNDPAQWYQLKDSPWVNTDADWNVIPMGGAGGNPYGFPIPITVTPYDISSAGGYFLVDGTLSSPVVNLPDNPAIGTAVTYTQYPTNLTASLEVHPFGAGSIDSSSVRTYLGGQFAVTLVHMGSNVWLEQSTNSLKFAFFNVPNQSPMDFQPVGPMRIQGPRVTVDTQPGLNNNFVAFQIGPTEVDSNNGSTPNLDTPRDYVVKCDATGGCLVNLPVSPTPYAMQEIVISDTYGTCGPSDTITIDGGPFNIGSAGTTLVLNTPNVSVTLIFGANRWNIASNTAGGGGGPTYTDKNVSASASVSSTEDRVYVDTVAASGAVTLTLPASPVARESHIVLDSTGNASTNNIILDGNGNNFAINGTATYTLSAPGESILVTWSATASLWMVS